MSTAASSRARPSRTLLSRSRGVHRGGVPGRAISDTAEPVQGCVPRRAACALMPPSDHQKPQKATHEYLSGRVLNEERSVYITVAHVFGRQCLVSRGGKHARLSAETRTFPNTACFTRPLISRDMHTVIGGIWPVDREFRVSAFIEQKLPATFNPCGLRACRFFRLTSVRYFRMENTCQMAARCGS